MSARWLARLLRPRLQAWAATRLGPGGVPGRPDFEVVRNDRDVYLRRWWVVPRNNWFNIYLHNMLRDDDNILHDHMYASVSLVLTDGLNEVYCEHPAWDALRRVPRSDGSEGPIELRTATRIIRGGDLVWRSSKMAHQLIVNNKGPDGAGTAWTLFITGPRVKQWGFWCPKGFRHWKDYVAVTQDPSVRGNGSGNTSGKGVGCGEMS